MTRVSIEVAAELGIPPGTLQQLIRSGRLRPPAKDASGRYCWTPGDVAAARAALSVDRRRKEHRRPRPGIAAPTT
jgi:hypothetical protein